MNAGTALLAHSDSGSAGLWGLAFVGVMMGAATLWLVRINRRLDVKEDGVEPQKKSIANALLIGGVVIALGAMFFVVFRAQSNMKSEAPQQVMTDLCTAVTQAATDPAAALKTYNGRPHNALHTLVSDLRAKDAAAAGRLSRAEQQAEEGLNTKSPDAAEFVRTLAKETANGYRSIDPNVDIKDCS